MKKTQIKDLKNYTQIGYVILSRAKKNVVQSIDEKEKTYRLLALTAEEQEKYPNATHRIANYEAPYIKTLKEDTEKIIENRDFLTKLVKLKGKCTFLQLSEGAVKEEYLSHPIYFCEIKMFQTSDTSQIDSIHQINQFFPQSTK